MTLRALLRPKTLNMEPLGVTLGKRGQNPQKVSSKSDVKNERVFSSKMIPF